MTTCRTRRAAACPSDEQPRADAPAIQVGQCERGIAASVRPQPVRQNLADQPESRGHRQAAMAAQVLGNQPGPQHGGQRTVVALRCGDRAMRLRLAP
ncbi:hypothetical protein [Nocardia pseudovaccinii]|uniref:hypothetical protein n=1 Tax=Nocardia pseudovaccinii TaxID=189540 RepID=UPI0012F4CB90|nr:hypothetical protein [Nocardia pseudovaccinii]